MMTPELIREAAEAIAEMRKSDASRRLTQRELAKAKQRMNERIYQQEVTKLESGETLTCWIGSIKDK